MIHELRSSLAPQQACPRIAVCSSPEVLSQLSDPEVSAVVWVRNPPDADEFPEFAAPAPTEYGCLPGWLRDDIVALAERLTPWVSNEGCPVVRLETVRERACPTFHLDALRARLLVAYRGPGVEFGLRRDDLPLFQTPRGAVAVFKGRSWPAPDPPLLHRSPPASTRKPRWLLTIDVS